MGIVTRFFALVLGLGLLAQTSLPISEYTCRYTGARLERCCCTGATSTASPVWKRDGCCDVSVTSFAAVPGTMESWQSTLTPPLALVPPTLSLVAASHAITLVDERAAVAPQARPRGTGPPIYLLARHLLI